MSGTGAWGLRYASPQRFKGFGFRFRIEGLGFILQLYGVCNTVNNLLAESPGP